MEVVIEYDYYTLDQAREIIKKENRERARKIAKQKARKKEKMYCLFVQKIAGIVLLICAAMIYFMPDPDKTTLLVFVPFGLWLLFCYLNFYWKM